MRILRPYRYAMFIGWLGVMTVVLLAPAGGVSADPAALSRVAWLQQALSSVVIWAAKDGSLWHVVWFLVLGALTAVLSPPPPSLRKVLQLLILLNAYSIVTEMVQETMVPGRAFEWSDVWWNAVGCIAGVTLMMRRDDERGMREES